MLLDYRASDLARKILAATAELDQLARQEVELSRTHDPALARTIEQHRKQLRRKFAELARLCKQAERKAA